MINPPLGRVVKNRDGILVAGESVMSAPREF